MTYLTLVWRIEYGGTRWLLWKRMNESIRMSEIVFTTDPRVVEGARCLKEITFEEMLELASLGSRVLHSRSVEFASKYQVPLRVLSTFEEAPAR